VQFVRTRTRGVHEFVRVEGFVRLDTGVPRS